MEARTSARACGSTRACVRLYARVHVRTCAYVRVLIPRTLVDDERVSHEEVGDVARERVVDARLLKLLVPKVVHRRRHVVELLVTRAAVGQVARDGVVAAPRRRRGPHTTGE
eukprot:6183903-Pleurochrysis_carterae.AAC.1